MAITLSDKLKARLEAVRLENVAQPSSRSKPDPISTEAELCNVFMQAFDGQEGWVSYPEAAGLDVLVVLNDGRRIAVLLFCSCQPLPLQITVQSVAEKT